MRAGALCCLNGRIILDCEDTHDVQGNPWIRWRTQGNSAAARFVQGLSREQFLAALTARNICLVGAIAPGGLTLPIDGDLNDVSGYWHSEYNH